MHAGNTEIGSNRIECQQLRPALSLISFLPLNSHPLSAWFPHAGHLNLIFSHPHSLLSVTDISSAVYNHIRSSFRTQVLENGSLLMQDVQKSDSGLFLCRASNGIGTDLSKVIRLTVHGKDIIFYYGCCVWCDVTHSVSWHVWSFMSRPSTRKENIHCMMRKRLHLLQLLFYSSLTSLLPDIHIKSVIYSNDKQQKEMPE